MLTLPFVIHNYPLFINEKVLIIFDYWLRSFFAVSKKGIRSSVWENISPLIVLAGEFIQICLDFSKLFLFLYAKAFWVPICDHLFFYIVSVDLFCVDTLTLPLEEILF